MKKHCYCRGGRSGACRRTGDGPEEVLVIVVKGLDNPFFEAIHQGCEKWNGENADSEYDCFYTGPASTSDEAGEAQIVAGHARPKPTSPRWPSRRRTRS